MVTSRESLTSSNCKPSRPAARAVEHRLLGTSGILVSSIGLGCVTFGREIDADTSFRVMDRAFEHGVNLFDTAEVYGEGASEQIVGQWLTARGHRESVVVATKVHLPLTRGHLLASTEQSLKRLKIDRIDLLQLHSWDEVTPLDETLEALDALVKQGKVRAIGCSNFTAEQLVQCLVYQRTCEQQQLVSIQPRYSLVCREIEMDLLPCCERCEVGVISYSPLGAGFLTGKYRPESAVPAGTRFDIKPGHQRIYFNDRAFRVVEALNACAKKWNVPAVRLALAWVMRRPTITSVLIGARTPEHVDQAVDAQRLDLTGEMQDELNLISFRCVDPEEADPASDQASPVPPS